jgi:hypothetical protein
LHESGNASFGLDHQSPPLIASTPFSAKHSPEVAARHRDLQDLRRPQTRSQNESDSAQRVFCPKKVIRRMWITY